MKLIKKKYKDKNGERREGNVWTVRFHLGGRQYEKSLGTRDRRVAELLGAKLVREAELRRAGIVDPFSESKERPISEHIADFLTTMKARNVVERYRLDREKCLRAFVAHANVKTLADVDLPRASAWLSAIRATGVSARTVNIKYQSIRQFGLWLVQTRRAPYDPVDGLKPLNEAEDRRHTRRALTLEEARRLLRATRERALARAGAPHPHASPDRRARLDATRAKMVRLGEARALIYTLAVWTGLRKGELMRLRWCDLDLKRGRVTVTAESAKSRKVQTVELHPGVVEALVAARPPKVDITAPVIDAEYFPTCRTFDEDLKAAGIPKTDEAGLVADFHGLRTTFISWLAASGAHPRTAQHFARHASIETTMERYTDLRLLDLQGTIGKLPDPDAPTAIGTAAESA